MSDINNPDLESFREKWKAEFAAKTKGESATQKPVTKARRPSAVPKSTISKSQKDGGNDLSSQDEAGPSSPPAKRLSAQLQAAAQLKPDQQSALDLYEKAVEKETAGLLGESLKLYRQAFRMDDAVGKLYKDKHFPSAGSAKPPAPKSNLPQKPAAAKPAAPTKDNPRAAGGGTYETPEAPPEEVAQSTKNLLASFATLSISRAEPPIEGAEQPPCPIAELPEELLVRILTSLALSDLASFMRSTRTCKRIAYIVMTEDSIWKRLCLGREIGFAAMQYSWQYNVDGTELDELFDELILAPPRGSSPSSAQPALQDALQHEIESLARSTGDAAGPSNQTPIAVSTGLPPPMPTFELNKQYATWQKMFRHRPRIRFNGIYISTVNYIRPGQAAPDKTTWEQPVHIVTYYRYLRFFRDGRVLSLLTTKEPKVIVNEMVPKLLEPPREEETGTKKRRGARNVVGLEEASPVALVARGRWKLGGDPQSSSEDGVADELDEKALVAETEGCYDRYTYRMEFTLKGQERGRSRLVWKDYWCYNKGTDDWTEFGLKNDKAFVFSRVKSYGMGA